MIGVALRSNTDDFIKKAISAHGELYEYDLVDYVNNTTHIKIRCKTHGVFRQTPAAHLNGKGCPTCGFISSTEAKTLGRDAFIDRSTYLHQCRYSYDLVDYINGHTHVAIICPDHGVFKQRPSSHLRGMGCRSCATYMRTSDNIEFIRKAKCVHNDLYDYSLVDYSHGQTKVKIICKDHGVFLQTPTSHLVGSGCPTCSNGGGYKTSKPGTLYYVRFDLPELSLWKIGITNNTVKKRFSDFQVKPITLWKRRWGDGSIAAREEKRILKGGLYDQYKYTGEPLIKSGYTECFTIDIMQLGNTTRVARSVT
jgi:hypothetical protein